MDEAPKSGTGKVVIPKPDEATKAYFPIASSRRRWRAGPLDVRQPRGVRERPVADKAADASARSRPGFDARSRHRPRRRELDRQAGRLDLEESLRLGQAM